MNEFQLFAFVILPIGVALLGGLAVWAARFIPQARRWPVHLDRSAIRCYDGSAIDRENVHDATRTAAKPVGGSPGRTWQPHVLDAESRVSDPRAYVFAIIDAQRAAVKRREIFASPGTRSGDPRLGMLEGATWQASKLVVCRALNRSLDAETEIAALAKLLDGAQRTVADRAASNSDLRFETVDGKSRIVVTPLDRLQDTESLRALRPVVQGRMPKARMPDLFLENHAADLVLLKPSLHPSQRAAGKGSLTASYI